MKKRVYLVAGLVLLLGFTSCNSGDSERHGSGDHTRRGATAETIPPPGGLQIVCGHYVFGHEVRALRPCSGDDELWVLDSTSLLAGLHKELVPETTPYAEIFVVVEGRIEPPPNEGFGAEYAGAFSVDKVIYAAYEGFGCDFDWNRFIYRAQGNEPFWSVEVLETGMRLTRPGEPDLVWNDVKEDRTGDAVIFHAIGKDRSMVQLVIEPGPSRDTMSGAYYGLSSRLILDGQSFTGNALPGAAKSRARLPE